MKIKTILFYGVLVWFLLSSCNKRDNHPPSDLYFNKGCNLDEGPSGVKKVKYEKGTLEWKTTMPGLIVPEPVFIIRVPDSLPRRVCNMPEWFKMEKDTAIAITFGGRFAILSEKAGASWTLIELDYLKFD